MTLQPPFNPSKLAFNPPSSLGVQSLHPPFIPPSPPLATHPPYTPLGVEAPLGRGFNPFHGNICRQSLIEARAKMRLADEYDAAQERGEAAKDGKPKTVVDDNGFKPATAADLGLRRDEIHDARQLTECQRAMAAAKLANMPAHRRIKSANLPGLPLSELARAQPPMTSQAEAETQRRPVAFRW